MDWTVVVPIGISLIATGIAISAELRSRRVETRAAAAARREEVSFRIVEVKKTGDSVIAKVVNDGHSTAQNVRVKPASVMRVSWNGLSAFGSVPPNSPESLRYKETGSRLESITLTWEGPGMGEQHVQIPRPDPEPGSASE